MPEACDTSPKLYENSPLKRAVLDSIKNLKAIQEKYPKPGLLAKKNESQETLFGFCSELINLMESAEALVVPHYDNYRIPTKLEKTGLLAKSLPLFHRLNNLWKVYSVLRTKIGKENVVHPMYAECLGLLSLFFKNIPKHPQSLQALFSFVNPQDEPPSPLRDEKVIQEEKALYDRSFETIFTKICSSVENYFLEDFRRPLKDVKKTAEPTKAYADTQFYLEIKRILVSIEGIQKKHPKPKFWSRGPKSLRDKSVFQFSCEAATVLKQINELLLEYFDNRQIPSLYELGKILLQCILLNYHVNDLMDQFDDLKFKTKQYPAHYPMFVDILQLIGSILEPGKLRSILDLSSFLNPLFWDYEGLWAELAAHYRIDHVHATFWAYVNEPLKPTGVRAAVLEERPLPKHPALPEVEVKEVKGVIAPLVKESQEDEASLRQCIEACCADVYGPNEYLKSDKKTLFLSGQHISNLLDRLTKLSFFQAKVGNFECQGSKSTQEAMKSLIRRLLEDALDQCDAMLNKFKVPETRQAWWQNELDLGDVALFINDTDLVGFLGSKPEDFEPLDIRRLACKQRYETCMNVNKAQDEVVLAAAKVEPKPNLAEKPSPAQPLPTKTAKQESNISYNFLLRLIAEPLDRKIAAVLIVAGAVGLSSGGWVFGGLSMALGISLLLRRTSSKYDSALMKLSLFRSGPGPTGRESYDFVLSHHYSNI